MFLSVIGEDGVNEALNKIGLRASAEEANTAIIKINLARPPEKNHPRTSPELITYVVKYLARYNVKCTICESAYGHLKENITIIGLENLIKDYDINLIDLEYEEVEEIKLNDESHYIPKCIKNYDIRIAIPATSKRPKMIFSNNVKLFVGAVPSKYYQIDDEIVYWRPKIHIDLHKSVSSIYTAISEYYPFNYFINGGLLMDEKVGEYEMPEILVGTDAIELDMFILKKYFDIEVPDYLRKIMSNI